MTHVILSEMVASIAEFERNPMATVNNAGDRPLAILNRKKPVFYCVPAKRYKAMLEALEDALEDAHWAEIVRARAGDKEIEVNIDDL